MDVIVFEGAFYTMMGRLIESIDNINNNLVNFLERMEEVIQRESN